MATFKRQTGSGWEHISLPVNIGMSPQTLGYAERTSDQTGITAGNPGTPITGLSVTVVVPAGRRLRITGHGHGQINAAGFQCNLRIRQDGGIISEAPERLDTANAAYQFRGQVVVSPTAGTHTYDVTFGTDSGGTATFNAGASYPAFILVEDITGSTLPYQPASVPVGRIAYAEVVAQQTGITAEVDLTGLSVNVVVPAGRTIRVTGHGYLQNSAGGNNQALTIYQDGVQVQSGQLVSGGVSLAEKLTVTWVGSPSAGAHTYKLRALAAAGTSALIAGAQYPAFILVEDITPTPAPSDGAPGSTLGYASSTATQATVGSEVDITGLTTTVTVPEGRRLKITARTNLAGSTAGVGAFILIKESTTELGRGTTIVDSAREAGIVAETIITPAAGTHTYKATLQAAGGTVSTVSLTSSPNFILVEDITGSVWPEGSAVTAGMIASEAWTSYTATLTQGVTVPVTTISARYTKIGRTVHFATRLIAAGAGTLGQPIYIGLPPHASSSAGVTMVGVGTLYDASANLRYQGLAALPSTTTIGLLPVNGTGNGYLGVYDFVAALATNDEIFVSGTYEAAS